jgi:hypothetical protein
VEAYSRGRRGATGSGRDGALTAVKSEELLLEPRMFSLLQFELAVAFFRQQRFFALEVIVNRRGILTP